MDYGGGPDEVLETGKLVIYIEQGLHKTASKVVCFFPTKRAANPNSSDSCHPAMLIQHLKSSSLDRDILVWIRIRTSG
jgi:hypothetical protein